LCSVKYDKNGAFEAWNEPPLRLSLHNSEHHGIKGIGSSSVAFNHFSLRSGFLIHRFDPILDSKDACSAH